MSDHSIYTCQRGTEIWELTEKPSGRVSHLERQCLHLLTETKNSKQADINKKRIPVGLLPCVCPQVSGEVCRTGEDFPTVPGERWGGRKAEKKGRVVG